MMTVMTAIEVEDLTKRFGHYTAVDHIDFKVEAGELFGFLGPNGAGKTTTVRGIIDERSFWHFLGQSSLSLMRSWWVYRRSARCHQLWQDPGQQR